MNLNNWFKKEIPLKGLFGTGVGGAGAGDVGPWPTSVTYSGTHTTTTSGGDTIMTITGAGALTVRGDNPVPMDFLLVARGGACSNWYFGGGGGGGGVVYGTNLAVTAGPGTPYPVAMTDYLYSWNGITANRGGGCGRPYGNRPSQVGGPPNLAPVTPSNPTNPNEAKCGIPGGSGGGGGRPNSGVVGGTATQPGQPQPSDATSAPGFAQYGGNGSSNGGGGGAGTNGSGVTGGNGVTIAITGSGISYGAGASNPNFPTAGYNGTGGAADPYTPGRGGGGGYPGEGWSATVNKPFNFGTPGSVILRYPTP